MKKLTFILTSLVFCLQSSMAQDPAPQVVPLAAVECEVEESFGDAPFEAELWAARLSEPDQDLRMAAYEAVTEAAQGRPEIFRALQAWAKDKSRGELSWTARMALREIAQKQKQKQEREPWGFGNSDLEGLSDEPLGLSHSQFERIFLEKFEQAHRRMAQGLSPGAAPGTGVVPRVFRLDFGPEGWSLNTRSFGVDGDVHQHWEAESIEALLSAHPELEEEFPVLGDLRLRFGLPGMNSAPVIAPLDEGPRTDVLGVECRPLTSTEAAAMELTEEQQGLLVARTVPGSIADELGVRRGDILLSLNDAALGAPSDITDALARRAAGDPIHLELIDTQGQGRSLGWSPRPLNDLEEPR